MLRAPKAAVEEFIQDVAWLWSNGDVAVLEEPPTAIEFLRDYVAVSRPCIIRFSRSPSSPMMPQLTLNALVDRLPEDTELNVDVSPDGHADVIRRVEVERYKESECLKEDSSYQRMFVQPEERRLSVRDFQKMLRKSNSKNCENEQECSCFNRVFSSPKGAQASQNNRTDNDAEVVVYYSRQNDCLRSELPQLWAEGLFPTSFRWAEEAFGTGPPQAVNLWIGNENVVSSMHKDHYENLFYVLSGEKIFTLCPPADAPFLYEREFPSGRFCFEHQKWSVVPAVDSDNVVSTVLWVEADVTRKDDPKHLEQFPLIKYAHPIEIKVPAGCMLYLPSLWFHRVTQSCETVGINYWYDMKFESPLWCYFHLLQQAEIREEDPLGGSKS